MSVNWQNRRRVQSLVAHGRVKKQHQNDNVFNLRLHTLTDGEMRIFAKSSATITTFKARLKTELLSAAYDTI